MEKNVTILILTLVVLILLATILFKKEGVQIPLPNYVKVSTTTINHGGIIKNRDDIPSNQNIPSDPILVDVSDEAIENWSTCRNEEYGFEFKYPSEWFVHGALPRIVKETNRCETLWSNSVDVSPSKTISHTRGDIFARFSLSFKNQLDFENTIFFGIQSVDDYYKRSSKVTLGLPSLESDTERKTNIDGETAFWKSNNPRNTIPSTHVQFFHNDTLFWINADFLDPQLIDAVISTFRFID